MTRTQLCCFALGLGYFFQDFAKHPNAEIISAVWLAASMVIFAVQCSSKGEIK